MRTLMMLFVMSCILTAMAGSEITWKGGGDTTAWSDGSNWVGGTAPGLGDTAVIPAGCDAIAGDADYTYMNADATKFAGIRIEADGQISVSNLSKSVTHAIPLSGAGTFRGVRTKNDCHVTMNVDNSAFTGAFYFYLCGITLSHANGLGTSGNKVTYYGNGGATRYFQYNCSGSNAEVHLYGNNGNYLYYGPNTKSVSGPHYFHGGTMRVWGSGNCSFNLKNSVTYDGPANKGLSCQSQVYFIDDGTVDLGSGYISSDGSWSSSYFGVYIGKPVIRGTLIDNGSRIRLQDRANILSDDVTVKFNAASCRLNLYGGFDQQCGDITFGTAVTGDSRIDATTAAKFTVRGTANRDVKALLNGKLSFALDSVKDPDAPGVFTLVSPGHTMDGTLSVSRGTLTLGELSTFSNVTALVSTNAGVLVVNTTNVNAHAALTTDAAANLELNADITVTTACVGDYYLPATTYDESSGYFNGTGRLTVLTKPVVIKEATYVGTDDDFLNPENWEGGKLPDFTHGEVRVTLGQAGSPATLTMPSGIHVYGLVLKGEVAMTLTGEKLYLGAGGVVCEKPGDAAVANVLDLPVEAEVVPASWTIPSGVSLQVKQPMTGTALLDYAVTISGGGTLKLDADSRDLEPPLVLDNLTLYVNDSYALGSTNRFTKIKAKKEYSLYFKSKLVNYVPIDLTCYGTLYYFGNFNAGFEQAGEARLNLTMSLCNGYVFSGGLSGNGTYYTIGYSYTICGKPMNMPSGSLYQDGSTLAILSTGNVFQRITQVKGATNCKTNDALCATGTFQFGRENAGYRMGTLNLGGFDQDIGALVNGATVSSGDTTVYGVISSTEAGTITTHDATSRNVALKFTGLAGYAHAGTGTYSFYNHASTTKGALKVLAGGVALKTGTTFSQVTDVTVAAGAKLSVGSDVAENAFSSGGKSKAILHLTTGDTSSELALEGGTVTVRQLFVNGVCRPAGRYDKSNCAAITGDGQLNVLGPNGTVFLVR